jgi:hypothetical protein
MIKPEVDYASDEDVARYLGRLLRYIAQGSTFVFKFWSAVTLAFQNSFVGKSKMKEDLSMIKLNYGETEKYSVWDVFCKYYSWFTVMGVHFSVRIDNGLYNLFRGWKYYTEEEVDFKLLESHIQFIYGVICGKEKDSFNYLIGWLANIFQNVLFCLFVCLFFL